jgi:Papain-like cysteine protease AvrRpt2
MPRFDLLESSIYYKSQSLASIDIAGLFYQFAFLPFNMQSQTQSNWCWAATSTSVSKFYSFFSTWTQCRVAGAELSLTTCCDATVPAACNVPWYLDRALTRTSNFDHIVSGTIDFATILSEIRAGRVIGARQGWSGGGGHFMVICGCSRIGSLAFLDIDDPIYGKSTITYETFSTNYQGSGTWTHTYFTKRRFRLFYELQPLPEFVLKHIEEMAKLRHLKKGFDMSDFKPELSAAVPHHVYVAGLDMLAKGRLPEHPNSLRVLEMQGENLEAVYDFDATATDQPGLHGLNENVALNDLLSRGLEVVNRVTRTGEAEEGDSKKQELRYIKIPALYVEGFWLHGKNDKEDVVVLTRSGQLAPELQAIPFVDFLKAAEKEAKSRLSAKPDDLIAP